MKNFLLLLFFLPITLFAQSSDQFSGTFSNQQIQLSLQSQYDQYTGQVQMEGQTFPVTAKSISANQLSGSYDYFGIAVPFTAVLQGQVLTIYSDGGNVQLKKIETPNSGAASGLASATNNGLLQNDDWGMAFTPPPSWQLKGAEDGYLMGSNKITGLLIILPHEASNLDELRQEASKGLNEGPGTSLQLEGPLDNFGENGLKGIFTGMLQGEQAKACVIGLVSKAGTGATIMAITTPEKFSPSHIEQAELLAKNIRFYKPKTSPMAQNWKEKLNGCKLSYFDRYSSGSYGGYTTEIKMDLCPQGYFRYGMEDETVINSNPGTLNGGYSMQYGKGSGTWKVKGSGNKVKLVLNFYNGEVYEYELSSNEKGQTFLNGKRYLRTCNPNDQVVEARPNCWN